MKVLILLLVGSLAAAIAFGTNWIALIPWRRANGQRWSERARLCFPVRAAATYNFWAIPAVLTMSCVLFLPDHAPTLPKPLRGKGVVFSAALGLVTMLLVLRLTQGF